MNSFAAAVPALSPMRHAGWLTRLRADEPRFFALGLLMLVAMVPTLFAAGLDERTYLGVNVWEKPFKFELALVVYLFSLAFFARFIPRPVRERRWYRVYSAAVVVAVVLEMLWIGGAAMLATGSHFNRTPPGDIIYAFMGVAAVLLTSISFVYAWQIGRNRATGLQPALHESLVLGLGLVLPLTLVTAGVLASGDSHAIGGSGSDAGGLALMGWSRDGGDLRVAHFFATHALHFIPAFGLLSALLLGGDRRLPVRIFAALFVALVAFTFVQARVGKPFLPGLG